MEKKVTFHLERHPPNSLYLRRPKNKQKLNALLHIYEIYEVITNNYLSEPNTQLYKNINIFYIRKLVPTIQKLVKELRLDAQVTVSGKNMPSNYIPFTSLFVAEGALYDRRKNSNHGKMIVRNNYGLIKELVENVRSFSQPSIQEIENMVSEARKLMDILSTTKTKKQEKNPLKIEITGMPVLQTRNTDESIIVKDSKKRITLPGFPRTEWAKVSIQFLSERDILLSSGKNVKPSSFEGLGCDDERKGKPDKSWEFLLKLARGNGQTEPINKDKRERQKKQKQKITDILRKVFKNDTDPFETESGGVYKAKFNIEYLNKEVSNATTKDKFSDLKEFHSEITTPTQENIEHDRYEL